jgi:hypothetical protein
MTEASKDSLSPITVGVADELARSLTSDRMGVLKSGGKAYLTHVGKRTTIHLLPYQLTVRGINEVVRENDPWPGD